MKKLFSILMVFFFIPTFFLKAQKTIVLQKDTVSFLYSRIDSAIANAENGNYIYLPGKVFNEDIVIDKAVHIIGAGHYLDSSSATGITKINGNISITSAANGGSISGVYFTGNFSFGHNITNYLIYRCRIFYLNFSSTDRNILVHGCVLANLNGLNAENIYFRNNIIDGDVWKFDNGCAFTNNIFLYNGSSYFLSYVNNCFFENNAFRKDSIDFFYLSSSNVFNNNLFASNPNMSAQSSANNLFSIPFSNVFVLPGNSFNYNDNYHLKQGSPAIGAGSGGQDIGIYSGLYPYKDGALPKNPHIQSKFISGSTDINGNLQISIKVRAQDN